MSLIASGIAASVVPSSPTGAIAVFASAVLVCFVAFFAFLAVAPLVSDEWGEKLNATPEGGPSIETTANEAD